MAEPVNRLYQNHVPLAGAGIADVQPDVPFKILVANFGESPHNVVPNQHIATAEEHPTSLIESHISQGEMFGLVPDAPSNDDVKFRQWVFNPRDTDAINRHISDERQKHLEDEEKPITTDDIDLDVSEDFEEDVRNILPKHARLWTRKLGQINAADMRIDLVADAKPFKSPPYRAGSKTLQLEQN